MSLKCGFGAFPTPFHFWKALYKKPGDGEKFYLTSLFMVPTFRNSLQVQYQGIGLNKWSFSHTVGAVCH